MEKEFVFKGTPYDFTEFLDATFDEINRVGDLPFTLDWFNYPGSERSYSRFINSDSIFDENEIFIPVDAKVALTIIKGRQSTYLYSILSRLIPSKRTKITLVDFDVDETSLGIWEQLCDHAEKYEYLEGYDAQEVLFQPWRKIPDIGWDRQALKLWWEDLTSREIGHKLRRKPQTILNKISDLRRLHGEELVPKRRSSKKFDQSI